MTRIIENPEVLENNDIEDDRVATDEEVKDILNNIFNQ